MSDADSTGPAEPSPPARPDARFLGTAIVLTTLLAAIVGYLLNHATNESDRANDRAQQYALQASAELPAARQKAEADYFNYVLRQAELRKAGAAFWEASFIALEGDFRWSDMQAAAQAVADSTAASIPDDLGPDSAFGPARDPFFPNAFLTVRTAQATKLTALQDGENEIGGRWSKLTSEYSAVLTIFAVALFLLGTALGLYGSSRLMFAVLGVVLVAIGTGWSLNAARTPPGKVSEAAADSFTLGEHYLATASNKDGLDQAIAAFTDAVEERPTFARAYFERSVAEGSRGSQAVGGGFLSNVEDEWLEKQIADEQKAFDLGLRDTGLLNNLGFDQYVWWLRHESGRPPSESIDLFRDVTTRDPEDPVTWMNLALILLADGQIEEAESVYRIGIQHILYTGPTADVPRVNAGGRQGQWLSGALTDLDNLELGHAVADKPEIQEAARTMKLLVATALATNGDDPPATEVDIDEDSIAFVVTPDGPQVSFTTPDGYGGDTGKDIAEEAVTIVWYQRPPSDGGVENAWNGISEITNWGSKDFGYHPLQYSSNDGTYFDNEHFLQFARQCLPTADYKVEIYINGRLEVSAVEPAIDTGQLTAAYESDMRVGFCRPEDWALHEDFLGTGPDGQTGSLEGIVFGYEAPDRSQGAYMFRIYPYSGAFFDADGDGDTHDVTETMMAAAVGFLSGDALANDLAVEDEEAGLYFMALGQTDREIYGSGSTGTAAVVGGGQTDDGAIVVGIVFGPSDQIDFFDDTISELEKVYDSISAV